MMFGQRNVRYFLFWIIVACWGTSTIAQTRNNYNKYIVNGSIPGGKPAIDFTTLAVATEQLGDFAAISRDGRYCSYVIKGPEDYTMIQAMEGAWLHKLMGMHPGFFSGDNRYYVYQVNDSLCFLPLKGGACTVMEDVVTYQLPPDDDRNEWLAVHLKNKNLLLRNFVTGKEYRLNGVINYNFSGGNWFTCQLDNVAKELVTVQLSTGQARHYGNVLAHTFDESKQALVLQTELASMQGLQWVDPASGKLTLVWTADKHDGSIIGSFTVDKAGQRLVFTVQTGSPKDRDLSVWYYKKGMARAIQKDFHDGEGRMAGLELTGAPVFSADGRYIVVSMRESMTDNRKPAANAVQVNVWNYQDTILMSAQMAGMDGTLQAWLKEKVFKFSMPVEGTGPVNYLSGNHETLFLAGAGEYSLMERKIITDRTWEDWAASELYVVALRDGQRIRLRKSIIGAQFSPDGTWILCYDQAEGRYFRYDIEARQYRDLSSRAAVYFGGEDEFSGVGRQPELPRGVAGWLEGGTSILVYDHYDIWQLDLAGKKQPINLTNGRKDKVRFEITRSELEEKGGIFYASLSRMLLTAVNIENKDNGFYALSLGRQVGLECLYMGPYVFYLGGLSYGQSYSGRYSTGRSPLKARDADVWLLVRQSATEAPNYFVTRGLKEFKALTSLRPHGDYNWLQAELVSFRQQDGSNCKGILYKPENFDPAQKYPVLIHYYDQFSLCLNQYPVQDYTVSGYINIPWFVSRGYLVFLADIYFNKGANGKADIKETKIPGGQAALNAAEGAASWLAGLPYVDSTKMGIAGHSMAGGLTSYILTHSNRFAAAFMGAGVTDWVSSVLQLDCQNGASRLHVPTNNGPSGADIWTNNAKCLDNPILHVGAVTSPLLMFHCKDDSAVPFEQAVEMFVAMRRMGKKAWLLQYDQGGHSTKKVRDSKDLTIRVTQFFDHYLKGAPPSIWMTRGIRAQLKGIETGYEFDESGRKP